MCPLLGRAAAVLIFVISSLPGVRSPFGATAVQSSTPRRSAKIDAPGMSAVVQSLSSPLPRVGVILVNFRGVDLTLACARSVLASRAVEVRLIVVENASGDDSARILAERLPEAHLVISPINGGYTGGNNLGLLEARRFDCDYVLLLNNDTIVAEDCIANLVHEAARDPGVALLNPRIFRGDDRTKLWFGGSKFDLWTGRPRSVGRKRSSEHGLPVPCDIPWATGCALLMPVAALDRLGPLDDSLFAYAEDLELSLRARAAGYRIRYVPSASLWHFESSSFRRTGSNALHQYFAARNELRVIGRYLAWYQWPTFLASFLVDHIGRFTLLSILHSDYRALLATYRGVLHAITGGRHPLEILANRPVEKV